MAYTLFTSSYGASYANKDVKIVDVTTGNLAIVMASATGGVISNTGNATLDGSGNLSVYLDAAVTWTVFLPASPGSAGTSVDRELVTETYSCINAFTGASIGDLITGTRVLDVTGSTATQVGSTSWFNETTGLALSGTPLSSNLGMGSSNGLTNAQLRASAVPMSAASLPLPTNASTSALQTAGNTSLSSIDTKLPAQVGGKVPVTDPTALPLPTNASTSALQTAGNTSLSSIDTKLPASLGAKTGANSLSHVLASDAVAEPGGVPITGQTMPTGGVGLTGWLSALFGKLPTIGQQTKAASLSITPASDATAEPGGVAITGQSMPSGGVGLTGWLSAIMGRLPTSVGANLLANTLSTSAPRKTSITGTTISTTVINTNLLDGSGAGAWLDVRDYNSVDVIVVSTATTGSYIAQSAFDSAGTIGLVTLTSQDTGVITGSAWAQAAITPTAATRQFRINVSGINYLRLNLTVGPTSGSIAAYATLSQGIHTPEWLNVVQNNAASLAVTASQATASSLNAAVIGTVAEDAAAGTTPVLTGGVVRTATSPTTLIAGDVARLTLSSSASLVTMPYAVPEVQWQAALTLTTTTSTAAKAAGAASIRNYVTGIQFQNTNATATTFTVLDGATVIANFSAAATMLNPVMLEFPTPLKGTAATALNIQCGTAAANLLVNIQGFQGA